MEKKFKIDLSNIEFIYSHDYFGESTYHSTSHHEGDAEVRVSIQKSLAPSIVSEIQPRLSDLKVGSLLRIVFHANDDRWYMAHRTSGGWVEYCQDGEGTFYPEDYYDNLNTDRFDIQLVHEAP